MTNRPKPKVFRVGETVLEQAPPPTTLDTDPTLPVEADPRDARPPQGSLRMRLFWSAVGGFISLALGVAVWDTLAALFAKHPWLGWAGTALGVAVLAGLLAFVIGELAALSRMRRVDGLRDRAEAAWESLDRAAADRVRGELSSLYRGRAEFERPSAEIEARHGDAPDADTLLILLEREAMRPLDARATDAAQRASRNVAAATALLPTGILDAAAVLYLNVRMVREIAQVYDGRAGWLGSWRLLKQVAFHLAATGAIALGDDLVGAVLGGGALAKLSRRAGEGMVNGALTARIGVATMEVCRPLPFRALDKPSVKSIAAAAIKGLRRS